MRARLHLEDGLELREFREFLHDLGVRVAADLGEQEARDVEDLLQLFGTLQLQAAGLEAAVLPKQLEEPVGEKGEGKRCWRRRGTDNWREGNL